MGGAGRGRDEEDVRDVTGPIVVCCCERMSTWWMFILLRPSAAPLLGTSRHEYREFEVLMCSIYLLYL